MTVKNQMRKYFAASNPVALSLLTISLALGLVLGFGVNHGITGNAPPTAYAQENTVKQFNLGILEWGFNQSKGGPTITVNKGDTVRILVTNKGSVPHTWTIDANSPAPFSATTKLLAAGGDTETISFVANEAGKFNYYCTVPGHRQLGMEGDIIVLDANASASTPTGQHNQHITGTAQAATTAPVLEAMATEKIANGVKFTFATEPKLPSVGGVTHLHFEVRDVVDNYRTTVQHIDPVVTITRGSTQVFKAFMHSHPGFFNINQVFDTPGLYNVKLEISTTPDTVAFQGKDYDFGSRTVEFTFEVPDAGSRTVVLDGVTVNFQAEPSSPLAGTPTTLTFITKDTAKDKPITHIDATMRIIKNGVTIYETTQAHSHVGVQKLIYSFPEPGVYTIETEFVSIPPSSLQFGKRAASFALEVKDPASPVEDKAKSALALAQDVDKDVHALEPKVDQALKTANDVKTLKDEVQTLQANVQGFQQQAITAPKEPDNLGIGAIAIAVVGIALAGISISRSRANKKPAA